MRQTRLWIILLLLLYQFTIQAPTASAEAACGESVKVRRGDTLSKIAKNCGTTISALMMANPRIKNPNKIFRGQVIELPRKPEPTAESATIVIRPDEDQLTSEQLSLLEIDEDSSERWIDVDLSSQTLSAYRGNQVVKTFLVSTGTWRFPTVTGTFAVRYKFDDDDMKGPGYFIRDVPFVMYFYKGYGLHGTYWHNSFGVPMSHGCVNLSEEDAKWLFYFASIGTRVNIHH
jgi:lipoprotein-anchoring transpeptidase ErfK/SrfK